MNLSRLDQLPPCVCRILARAEGGKRLLTLRQLVAKSGLPYSVVQRLSKKTSWRTVPCETCEAFSNACGVDHDASWRSKRYLREAHKVAWAAAKVYPIVADAMKRVIEERTVEPMPEPQLGRSAA